MRYEEQVIAGLMQLVAQREDELAQEQDPVTKQQRQHSLERAMKELQDWNTRYNAGHKPN
jgi:hypothetical protein